MPSSQGEGQFIIDLDLSPSPFYFILLFHINNIKNNTYILKIVPTTQIFYFRDIWDR